MKRILFLLLLCCPLGLPLLPGHLIAQGWEYLAPNDRLRRANTAMATPDGGVLVGGQGPLNSGWLICFDEIGSVVWQREVTEGEVYDLRPADQGYLVYGTGRTDNSPAIYELRIDRSGRSLGNRTQVLPELAVLFNWRAFDRPDGMLRLVGTLRYASSANNDNRAFIADWPPDAAPQFSLIEPDLDIRQLTPTPDGGFVLAGSVVDTNAATATVGRIVAIDSLGHTRWTKLGGVNPLEARYGGLLIAPDQSVLAVSYIPFGNTPLFLSRFDGADGTLLDRDSIPIETRFVPMGVQPGPNGSVIVQGMADQIPDQPGFKLGLTRLDSTGQLRWEKYYGYPDFLALPRGLVGDARAGYTLLGITSPEQRGYVVHTDSNGVSRSNLVTGRLVAHTDGCAGPVEEIFLSEWWLRAIPATGGDTLYGISDQTGQYAIPLDTGMYRLEVIPPNAYWSACEPAYEFTVGSVFDTAYIDPHVRAVYACPLPTVEVGSPLLRRCYTSQYTVRYRNEGTLPAPNALVEVALDSLFEPTGSTPPWTEREGQLLRYPIGSLAVGQQGNIRINGVIDCEKAAVGQTHCTEARIFPDSLCTPPGINWDGSSIEVSGTCVGDSVQFRIQNVGLDMAAPSQYVITQDVIIHQGGTFQLAANADLFVNIESDGFTYRLEAQQSDGHPGSSQPSATVEGCPGVEDGPISWGVLPGFPLDEGDPFVAIDCQTNRSSWDPNDIQVFPSGIGPERLVDLATDLEYRIRFQNTGTDTAFRVVIVDTLPPTLDRTSVRVGAASHSFRWQVDAAGALRFTFDPIALPDSTTDAAASQGFVQFKVRQAFTNEPGDRLVNRAAIYFDYNAPVLTNTALLNIRRPQRYAFGEDSICVLGQLRPLRSVRIDTIALATYDSLRVNGLTQLPAWHFQIDTVLTRGDSLGTRRIDASGQYIDSLTTEFGCDSLLFYDIVLPSSSAPQAAFRLRGYPNPVRDRYRVEYYLVGTAPTTITLTDLVGRSLVTRTDPRLGLSGFHSLILDLNGLSSGSYFVRIRSGPHRAVLRLQKL